MKFSSEQYWKDRNFGRDGLKIGIVAETIVCNADVPIIHTFNFFVPLQVICVSLI